MKNLIAISLIALSMAGTAMAGNDVMVGGEAMLPSKDIVANAMNSKEHTTLVAAVKAAGLVETLQGKGPFTVFAPVNNAFEDLPEGTVDTLLKPESKQMLAGILTYHVVPGRLDFAALAKQIKAGNGTAELKTVSGGKLWAIKLWAMMNGKQNITLKDEKGNVADISTYDVYQSNGVIHVINKVLMPE